MMLEERLRLLLEKVASGETQAEKAIEELRKLPFEDIDFAKIDQHRQLRQGMPEVIFCPGKTPEQVHYIATALLQNNDLVLATRADAKFAEELRGCADGFSRRDASEHRWGPIATSDGQRAERAPGFGAELELETGSTKIHHFEPEPGSAGGSPASKVNEIQTKVPIQYFPESRAIVWGNLPTADPAFGKVAIVTAGTADLPVAREAELVLNASAISTDLIADVGVAGLHRVIENIPRMQAADVCIVIAGMDGVLSSVVGGLLACPVIACPSSIGYGAAFEGLAALLTMLNSCAAGITVVNIDNGFGAAVAAFRILRQKSK